MPYAWAPIRLKHNANGRHDEKRPGDEVSESDFDDKEDYDLLRREGVIRDREFPEGVSQGESVRTAILRQANERYANDTGLPEAMAILDPAPSESEQTEEENNDNSQQQQQQERKQPWQR